MAFWCQAAAALAAPLPAANQVSPPVQLWTQPVAAAAVQPLTLIAYRWNPAAPGLAALELLTLPAAFGEDGKLGYGMIIGATKPSRDFLTISLSINSEILQRQLHDVRDLDRDELLAKILLALTNADLVLSVPQATADPWTLWRRHDGGPLQQVYSATLQGRAATATLDAESYRTFLRAALGYEAQIVATADDDYLVRIDDNHIPSPRSQAFGLSDSARLLRVADSTQRPALGFLRLLRGSAGWGVYHRVASATAEPWPVGTKLLLGDAP